MRLLALLIARLIREIGQLTRHDLWWFTRTFLVINGLFAVAVFIYLQQPYRLIYNNTWSMPKGLWIRNIHAGAPYHRGDTIQARYVAPDWVADRSWSDPLHTHLIKDIGAVPGDRLKVAGERISVCPPGQTCRFLARRLATDGSGTPMRHTPLPDIVPPHEYFLVGENPRSLDSRYLGLFGRNALIGHVRPLAVQAIPDKTKQLTRYQSYAEHTGGAASRRIERAPSLPQAAEDTTP